MATRRESDVIIVPGDGVCKAGFTAPDVAPFDSSWVGGCPGEGPLHIEHAKEGVRLAAENASVRGCDCLLLRSISDTANDNGQVGNGGRSLDEMHA